MAMAKASKAERFPCPRCGESIPILAKVCRFCDHELEPEATVQEEIPVRVEPEAPVQAEPPQSAPQDAQPSGVKVWTAASNEEPKERTSWWYWPLAIAGFILLFSIKPLMKEVFKSSPTSAENTAAQAELVKTLQIMNDQKLAITTLVNNESLNLTEVPQARLDAFVHAMNGVVSRFESVNRARLEQMHPELSSRLVNPYLQSAIAFRAAAMQRDLNLWNRGEKSLLSAAEWLMKNRQDIK
jgi:hypothetical protein